MTPGPALEFKDVRYRYPDGTLALDGLTLSVAPGECLGLVGPNGAGKTTLVQMLAGFLLPQEGSVSVGGVPLVAEHIAALRGRSGFLFVNPDDQLFMPTVLEDVCFGPLAAGVPAAEARTRALAVLTQLGLATFADRFPGHLSAGQKRLATLAGALVQSPSLLVLDEPTALLDPFARRGLLRQLAALPQTRLLATHDLEAVVSVCSRVAVIDAGRVVAQGPCAEVLGDEALMAAHRLERPHALLHRHPHQA